MSCLLQQMLINKYTIFLNICSLTIDNDILLLCVGRLGDSAGVLESDGYAPDLHQNVLHCDV